MIRKLIFTGALLFSLANIANAIEVIDPTVGQDDTPNLAWTKQNSNNTELAAKDATQDTAIGLNTAHKDTVTGNPHAISVSDVESESSVELVDSDSIQTLTNKTLDSYLNTVHADAVHYRAKATENILKCQPVVVTGYNAGEMAQEVQLADQSTGVATAIAAEDILTGSFGLMIQNGTLEGCDTSAFIDGDILYLNGSGAFSTTEPSTGYMQPIAYVLRSHAVNGAIQVLAAYPKQDAADVRFTPEGTIASTDTQAAIQEIKDEAPFVTEGSGAPTSTPSKVGDVYIDTTNDNSYTSIGTLSSSDWVQTDAAGGGSALEIQDETIQVDAATDTINFTGSGVTASSGGAGVVNVTVAGGAAPVDSVFGRTGAVVATSGDYTAALVDVLQNGTPTYTTMQDHVNLSSSGRITGGTITASGTDFDVAAGTGVIKSTDSPFGGTYFFDWSASTGNIIADGDTKHVFVVYSATPAITIKDTYSSTHTTEFYLGEVTREGAVLHILNDPDNVANGVAAINERFRHVYGFERSRDGGLILGETGVRNLTVTAGEIYSKSNEFSVSAIDTSGADTFRCYYKDVGGDYTNIVTGLTQWDNTYYDDGSGTLATIGNNQYTSSWYWIDSAGDLVHVYGEGSNATIAAAKDETIPSNLPDVLVSQAIFIGRAIIQQGASTVVEFQSAFTTPLSGSAVSSHGELSGILPDSHHDPVTLGTANGLSLSTQELSLSAATNSTPGAATAAHISAIEANTAKTGIPAMTDGQVLQAVGTTPTAVDFFTGLTYSLGADFSKLLYDTGVNLIDDTSNTATQLLTASEINSRIDAHCVEQATDPLFSGMSTGDCILSRASGDKFIKTSTGGFVIFGTYYAD